MRAVLQGMAQWVLALVALVLLAFWAGVYWIALATKAVLWWAGLFFWLAVWVPVEQITRDVIEYDPLGRTK